MCGICGIVGQHKNSQEVLERMMFRMHHRGPDDDGTYIDDKTMLGFKRLSIIDLEHGHQPMKNEDETVIVVFNGEIYNFHDLRVILEGKGHVFANHSDTECLIHAYEEYGKEMVAHLRGMYAFAIWDTKRQVLFAARDSFGIKPFYYTVQNETLVFGSEIKSILEYPEYKREVNLTALDCYLSYQYSVLPETLFQEVYKLLPGWSLEFKEGQIQLEQYYDPQLKQSHSKKVSKEQKMQVKEMLDQEIDASIEAHLVSDVEVGVLLSGGVDSNYLLHSSGVKKSFTVGFSEDNGRYSEMHQAKKMSDIMDCTNYQKQITAPEYWKRIQEAIYHMDEPLADPAAIALYFVDELAAKHVKVVLSGEGADELFGGYRIYHEPSSLRPFALVPGKCKKMLADSLQKSTRNFKGKNYLIRGCTPLQKRFIGNAKIFSKNEKEKLLKAKDITTEPSDLLQNMYAGMEKLDDVTKMQNIDIKNWLPGDILLKADKMSMAHSLESRVPFLDRKVYEAADRLPSSLKIRGNQTKYLFRQIAAKGLPEEVSEKKKLGFPVPIRVWLRQESYYKIVKECFLSKAAEQFFHTEVLLQMLDEHYNGSQDYSRKIWTIYIFLVWYRVFFEIEKFGNQDDV